MFIENKQNHLEYMNRLNSIENVSKELCVSIKSKLAKNKKIIDDPNFVIPVIPIINHKQFQFINRKSGKL